MQNYSTKKHGDPVMGNGVLKNLLQRLFGSVVQNLATPVMQK
jgi:hypothetical protein